MYDGNKNIFKWDWQNVVKLGVAVIVILTILRAVYSIFMVNDDIRLVSNIVSAQETQSKILHQEGDAEIRKVQSGLANGAKEMEGHAKQFESKMDNFYKDFSDSLQAELDRRESERRRDYIRHFLETHVDFYDAALYESDRKKAIGERHYPLPDYKQYSEMRETAMRCHVQFHNKEEEKRYRNKIAQLKTEHKDKLIPSVPKPDIWKWPLASEKSTKIKTDHYNLIFLMVTSKGQCRNV
jgi:hypothetical protein